MNGTKKRIVVVSHDATRTGAPRVAVEVQRSLRGDDVELVSILRAGGPLAAEFEAHADASVTEPLPRVRAVLRRQGWLHPVLNRWDELIAGVLLRRYRPDVVVLNTVRSANFLKPALRRGVPAVLYVHETGDWAWDVLRRHPIGDRWSEVRLVACSTDCRDAFAAVVGVQPDTVEVIHAPVDVRDIRRRGGLDADPAAEAENGADTDGAGLVVGACGSVEERKGTDLWLEVARRVRQQRPQLDVRFQWVGRVRTTWGPDLAKELDVADVVEFTGEAAEPAPRLARLDVFTLPSRLDPFPLVVLEAMSLGRPVVAFDIGGVAEQLGDAGVLVPAEDVDLMAKAVIDLLEDAAARTTLGRKARERVQAHWDVDVMFRPAVRRVVADATA